jgi:TonB family protein
MCGAKYSLIGVPTFAPEFDYYKKYYSGAILTSLVIILLWILSPVFPYRPTGVNFLSSKGRSIDFAFATAEKIVLEAGFISVLAGALFPETPHFQREGMLPIIAVEPDNPDGLPGLPAAGGISDSLSGQKDAEYAKDTISYLEHDSLIKVPELIWMKRPDFPDMAMKSGIVGKVILHVLVSEQGRPVQTKINAEEPSGYGFGEKALSAAQSALFNPALKDNRPVKCWVKLPVEFDLE